MLKKNSYYFLVIWYVYHEALKKKYHRDKTSEIMSPSFKVKEGACLTVIITVHFYSKDAFFDNFFFSHDQDMTVTI